MAKTKPEPVPDPEDMFNDTRMSFGDHIEDLRTHLLRAIKGFIIGMIIGIWPLGQYVYGIIVAPVEEQLDAFQKRKFEKEAREAEERFKLTGETLPKIRYVIEIQRADWEAAKQGKERERPVLDVMMRGFGHLITDLDVNS